MKILILCRENACRSQMAEAYLNFYTDNDVHIVSAGLTSTNVHPITIKVMHEDGIDISTNQSKSFLQFGNELFDYLITVCTDTLEVLPTNIKYLNHVHFDIPDPANTSLPKDEELELFRNVRETIKGDMVKFIGRQISYNKEAA